MKKKLPQLTSILLLIVLCGCVSLLFFSDRGLVSLWELKKEKSDIQQEINSLRKEISDLKKESEKLEFDQDYIEKIAREKLKMAKPGEKVFKVEE
ncbi:MAG: septum formation initiator family protein [Candidatus Neomarinimicrobiota bacterium]|nr:septum formation initiator family protein [Candidatus Neomarinimicrobiota bacterium]